MIRRLHDANPANLHKVHMTGEDDRDTLRFEERGMPQSEVTIADLLAAHGYHTMHVGKWHLGYANGSAPNDQGFAESVNMASGMYLPPDDPDVVNSRQEFDPIDRFLWANLRHAVDWNGGPRFKPDGYLMDYFTDQAVAAIEANRNRPFFLYLAHWAPHTPLQALRDNGIDDNTLVIFSSDNGGAGYIGLPEVNKPFRGWKITFFEGGIHVPFFMRWPALVEMPVLVDKTLADPQDPEDEYVYVPN